jgi:uncharacterized protein with gpF-like domain
MVINLKDKNSIAKYHRWVIKQWNMLEKKYSKMIRAVLKDQYQDAADYVSHGVGLESVNDAVNFNTKDLEAVLVKMYEQTDAIFHSKTVSATKSIRPSNHKATEGRYYYNLNKWIKKQTATRIKNVNDSTKANIRSIIENGMNNGMSNAEIAKDIMNVEGITNKYRATRIARTETHTASMRAETETLVEEGLNGVLKIWSATMDERTRDDHADADMYYSTNPIPVEEAFVVGDEYLMYPGDPNGSAGNVINCRCVMLYETKDMQ